MFRANTNTCSQKRRGREEEQEYSLVVEFIHSYIVLINGVHVFKVFSWCSMLPWYLLSCVRLWLWPLFLFPLVSGAEDLSVHLVYLLGEPALRIVDSLYCFLYFRPIHFCLDSYSFLPSTEFGFGCSFFPWIPELHRYVFCLCSFWCCPIDTYSYACSS